MHLGPSGCARLLSLRADNNEISYIQQNVKNCKSLEVLSLKKNHLGQNFLPIEFYQSPSLASSLCELYLSNNDIREVPL